jgi:hypothetical protein
MSTLTLLIASLQLAPAAPVPEGASPAAGFFNFPVGTKWEYSVPAKGAKNPDRGTGILEIAEVKEVEGVRIITTKYTRNDGKQVIRKYEVRKGELFDKEFEENGKMIAVAPGRMLTKSKLEKGDKWVYKYDLGEEVYTVGEEEDVDTPAGKVKAFPVKMQLGMYDVVTWYSKEGAIIRETECGYETLLLKKVTLGKK